MITTPPIAILIVAVAALVTYHELDSARIPNAVTYPAALLGLAMSLALGGASAFVSSALAVIFGVLAFAPVFGAGAMGGGDVKLVATLGALGGLAFMVEATSYGFVIGALHATGALLRRGALLENVGWGARILAARVGLGVPPPARDARSIVRIRLGIDLAAGAVLALAGHWLGWSMPFGELHGLTSPREV